MSNRKFAGASPRMSRAVQADSTFATMRKIKLSGREMAVARSIDYACGSTGAEITARTHLETEDIADILSGLMVVGYVESFPPAEHVAAAQVATMRFEINPSYALELKEALKRS